jgi:hypothetical protein
LAFKPFYRDFLVAVFFVVFFGAGLAGVLAAGSSPLVMVNMKGSGA